MNADRMFISYYPGNDRKQKGLIRKQICKLQ